MTDKPDADAVKNTDRELWRAREGDYYAPSIHVTEHGGIGINVGGIVFVMTLEQWHELAHRNVKPHTQPDADAVRERLKAAYEHAADRIEGTPLSLHAILLRDALALLDAQALEIARLRKAVRWFMSGTPGLKACRLKNCMTRSTAPSPSKETHHD